MQFSEFITEQKNTHMTHIEDKVIYGGVKGTRQAILALREYFAVEGLARFGQKLSTRLRDSFSNSSALPTKLTSPSCRA